MKASDHARRIADSLSNAGLPVDQRYLPILEKGIEFAEQDLMVRLRVKAEEMHRDYGEIIDLLWREDSKVS